MLDRSADKTNFIIAQLSQFDPDKTAAAIDAYLSDQKKNCKDNKELQNQFDTELSDTLYAIPDIIEKLKTQVLKLADGKWEYTSLYTPSFKQFKLILAHTEQYLKVYEALGDKTLYPSHFAASLLLDYGNLYDLAIYFVLMHTEKPALNTSQATLENLQKDIHEVRQWCERGLVFVRAIPDASLDNEEYKKKAKLVLNLSKSQSSVSDRSGYLTTGIDFQKGLNNVKILKQVVGLKSKGFEAERKGDVNYSSCYCFSDAQTLYTTSAQHYSEALQILENFTGYTMTKEQQKTELEQCLQQVRTKLATVAEVLHSMNPGASKEEKVVVSLGLSSLSLHNMGADDKDIQADAELFLIEADAMDSATPASLPIKPASTEKEEIEVKEIEAKKIKDSKDSDEDNETSVKLNPGFAEAISLSLHRNALYGSSSSSSSSTTSATKPASQVELASTINYGKKTRRGL